MSVITFNGTDYSAPTVEVQHNPSATSLENLKVPTGGTITSYLNSKFPDSGWIEDAIELFATSGKINYRRKGDVVTVVMRNTAFNGMTADSNNIFYVLPEGFRPYIQVLQRAYGNNGIIQVAANGNVSITPTGTSGWYGFSATFLV